MHCMIFPMALALAMTASVSQAVEGEPDPVEAAVAKVVAAYRTSKAMTVSSTLTLQLGSERRQEAFSTRFDAKGNVEIGTPNFDVVVLDGYLYMTVKGLDGTCLRRPYGDGLVTTMTNIFGTGDVVPWDAALRLQKEPGDWISLMTFGLMPGASFTGVKVDTMPGGDEPATVIEVTSTRGAGRLYVEPDTGVIRTFVAMVSNPVAPEDLRTELTVKIETKRLETLEPPITFDRKERKMVGSIEDMLPKSSPPVSSGKAAPGFNLAQLDGEDVTLSSLRGKIVVLDFWATWCPPCRKGLPLVQEFADWAKKNHPDDIVVYAVNVLEDRGRGRNDSQITELVSRYWLEQKFSMPTLISFDRQVTNAYMISGIPVTLMIDRTGDIATQHRGYTSSLFNDLKAEAQKLLGVDP